jgi:hypothetical protein
MQSPPMLHEEIQPAVFFQVKVSLLRISFDTPLLTLYFSLVRKMLFAVKVMIFI